MKHMLRFRIAAVLAAGFASLAAPALAEGGSPPVLIELYTSQGCSSCPPADAALGQLAKRSDVVALSLHVDYWDYLGWKDTFASPQYTKRQYAYKRTFGARVVYTPQIVVQGVEDAVGSRNGHVIDLIKMAQAKAEVARMALEEAGASLIARLQPVEGHQAAGTIWVARYDRSREIDIGRGENRGRMLTYHNVVRSLTEGGAWSGDGPYELTLDPPAVGEGVAVWLQEGVAGPIFAAAKYER